jgi:exopolyphosphatase / guanosine-5'-triphosphate,3'-diphosphate pyrophosphatase
MGMRPGDGTRGRGAASGGRGRVVTARGSPRVAGGLDAARDGADTRAGRFHPRRPILRPQERSVRIAAIDIGTNSIHMVVARATGPASFEVVDREREVVQIGRGSFTDGRLRADAIRRTLDALVRFAALARRLQVDRIVCTATAAVREARNGGTFVSAARAASGVHPRVIPAAEEGRLIWLAVKSALQLDEVPSLILDIGGGSMQLVVGDKERLLSVHSVPLGALRLTETLLDGDPPSRRDLQRLRRVIRQESRAALDAVAEMAPTRVFGSSGSIHALAQAAHELETGQPLAQVNGHVLARDALERLTRRLQRMDRATRERLPGIDAPRAEIIVPGALVLLHVLDALGAEGITLSDFGVREGLVTDYLGSHAREVTALEPIEDVRLRSVMALLTKFFPESRHSRHVAELALQLFDGLQRRHGLGPDERELLLYAGLLHDIGAVIGYDGHGEHSYYVIRNGNLRGLSADEVAVVANVARYHGKARPRKGDDGYRDLPRPRRRVVRWLAGLLRVAEGLDRSHYQLVPAVRVVRRDGSVTVHASTLRDARLELWAARRRTDLLERLLGERVRIVPERTAPARHQSRAGSGAGRAARPGRATGGRARRG